MGNTKLLESKLKLKEEELDNKIIEINNENENQMELLKTEYETMMNEELDVRDDKILQLGKSFEKEVKEKDDLVLQHKPQLDQLINKENKDKFQEYKLNFTEQK